MAREMDITEFIEDYLIKRIKSVIEDGKQHYFTFFLVCSGIEFLGACLDEFEFSKKKKSGARFKGALKNLNSLQKYDGYKDRLYEELRCGLLHVTIPRPGIALSQLEDTLNDKSKNCTIVNGKLLLYAECFYEDFTEGCLEIIKKIKTGEITHKKLKKFKFNG